MGPKIPMQSEGAYFEHKRFLQTVHVVSGYAALQVAGEHRRAPIDTAAKAIFGVIDWIVVSLRIYVDARCVLQIA